MQKAIPSPVFSAQKVTLVFPKVLEFNDTVFNFFMIRLKENITKTGSTLTKIGTQLCSRCLELSLLPSLGRH